MSKTPKVSIIIVNYNGKLFLNECLSSVFSVDFPEKDYEVVFIDNDSKDLSIDFVKRNFPRVKVIESKENLGFAGGVNLGVRHSLGKYVVLLNNDTKVDKGWLKYLYKAIEADKNVAAVNSKTYLYYPQVELTLKSDVFMRSEFSNSVNFQPVGVMVENIVLENQGLQNMVRYRSGFYDKEKGVISARWTKGDASIMIPCDPNSPSNNFTLTIRSEKYNSDLSTSFSAILGGERVIEDKLSSFEVKQYHIKIDTRRVRKFFKYPVQNAGVVVFRNGYGRDRGAAVKWTYQLYELDCPFYGRSAPIHAFSGVSVIIRKDIFLKLGGFDESFFMYYEDVDLSLRFRRMGLEIVFEPRSFLWHIHAGSSNEWSSFFIYHVEKNYLANLVKHFPIRMVIKEYIRYFFLYLLTLLRVIKWRFKEHWELFDEHKERFDSRSRVIWWLLGNLSKLFAKRMDLDAKQVVSKDKVFSTLY